MITTAQFEVAAWQPPTEKLLYADFLRLSEKHFPCTATLSKGTTHKIDLKELVPEGMRITRFYREKVEDLLVAEGAEMVACLRFVKDSGVYAHISSQDIDKSWDAVKAIMEKVPDQIDGDDTVRLSMWRNEPTVGPVRKYKTITAPTWTEAEVNYPDTVSASLSEIVKMNKPEDAGKIILWHGEPGTGKTSAIRSLMREWKPWCNFHYISDPEKMFQSPGYLMEVGSSDDKNWRLVIAEDTDEFLMSNAKHEAGAALGRLLNFADGILGQGCNTLFLMTTNEPVGKLHPAIVRPGRCLAQVEFRKFSAPEVRTWLGEGAQPPADPKTLAELIELRKTNKQIANGIAYEPVGNYL